MKHKGGGTTCLKQQPSDPISTERRPPFYEPVLLGFAPIAFR
jgi:hypothetical protein